MARDDFEIVEEKPIGCGQFGTVFRARRRHDGRMTALKLILRGGQNGADTIAAERRGATLQQRFGALHGRVPEVFEFGPDDEDFFIAMELVEGPSLEERLRTGALPYDEAVGHAMWLCEFLAEAHAFSPMVEGRQYRLLHNDLKPAHLKIPQHAERKVLDFGIAKALEETRELATDVGRTIAYAAPERLLSERVNVHADFWSLGVMLYEMACGHRPYPDLEGPRHRRQLYSAITNNTPRAPLPRDCPPHLQAIVNRLLAFQPEHRYQTATEIHADLERFANGDTPVAAAYFDTPATLPVTRATHTDTIARNSPATTANVPWMDAALTSAARAMSESLGLLPATANARGFARGADADASVPTNASAAGASAFAPSAAAPGTSPFPTTIAASTGASAPPAANHAAATIAPATEMPLAAGAPAFAQGADANAGAATNDSAAAAGTGAFPSAIAASAGASAPPAAKHAGATIAPATVMPLAGAPAFATGGDANAGGATNASGVAAGTAPSPTTIAASAGVSASAVASYAAAVPIVPATDPVPASTTPPTEIPLAVAAARAAAGPAARRVVRRTVASRFATIAATILAVLIIANEGVAWLFAEHFRDTIPAIDERTVTSSREAYDALARRSLFDLGLRLRVNPALVPALRGIGDRVIADYRREVPTMGAEDWRQAQAAFSWARMLSPRDSTLRSKELIAEGHVRRIAAQKARPASAVTTMSQAAVVRFRDAAAADPSSPDPYVGMAVPLVYGLGDVDGALAAIDEATKRGYVETRREKALIGDAYMRRAALTLKRAAVLSGDERQTALENARGDFEKCVSSFAPIVNYGKSAENLNACKAQMHKIDQQLADFGFKLGGFKFDFGKFDFGFKF